LLKLSDAFVQWHYNLNGEVAADVAQTTAHDIYSDGPVTEVEDVDVDSP
jgi:hypothetical protein